MDIITKLITKKTKGSIMIFSLVFGSVAFTIIISGLAGYALFQHKSTAINSVRDRAFHIAEAGAEYYRWHLAHYPTDYKDGTDTPGPYIHEYKDKDDNVIGYFSLEITPPVSGTAVMTVKSSGWVGEAPTAKRTVQITMARPALTDYSLLNNSNINFGFTSVTHGPVHSNGGIRFDGTSDTWVESAKETYQYLNQTHTGVWGGGGPKSFWKYPVPAVDFNGITLDLANLQASAEAEGIYLTSSGEQGWHLTLKADRTVDVYKVKTLKCYNGNGKYKNGVWQGTVVCVDIGTEEFFANYPIPASGSIFAEDNVWVQGVVNGHISIGAGQFPSSPANYRTIYINNNITYLEKVAGNSIGLLTEGDIVIPHDVPNDMVIEGALLSQYGKMTRPYYINNTRNSLTMYGSSISFETSGVKYTNGWGTVISGFVNTLYTYDANLRYFPPPFFPVKNVYELLSWREL